MKNQPLYDIQKINRQIKGNMIGRDHIWKNQVAKFLDLKNKKIKKKHKKRS